MNDDLLAPLVSESFTNVSSQAKASFSPAGMTSSSASTTTATITYNAGNQTYTLTTPTGSITFGPGDIDNSQSSPAAIVYSKENDDRVDSLTLTRPGTSGAVTYKYVGAAFWQSVRQVSPTRIDGSVDSIVYGVETTQADRQVSGSAKYAIDLLGVSTAGASDLVPITGYGTAAVDFSSGRIIFIGILQMTASTFFGDAKISSSAPTFSGTLVFNDGAPYELALKGQFFGPNSAEIGAVFSGESHDQRVMTGAILGRKGGVDTPNTLFNGDGQNHLLHSQTFAGVEASVSAATSSGGNVTASARIDPLAIRYDTDTGMYVVAGPDYTMETSDSSAVYYVYGARDSGTWADRTAGLDFDYLRVRLNQYEVGTAGGSSYRYGFQLYGMPTANSALTRTSTAGYGIHLDGVVADGANDKNWMMNGYGDFFVDFGTGKISAYVPLAYHNLSGSGAPGTGDWNYSGTLASSSNNFSGTVTFNGIGDYTGTLNGQFFGPSAQEVGGLFTATGPSGSAAAGAIFGVKDGNVGDPGAGVATLKSLTATTDLKIFEADLEQFYQTKIDAVSYNPSNGSYVVKLGSSNVSLDSTTLNSAKSDSNKRIYEGTDLFQSGDSWTAMVPNLASASSNIALTYTMFVDATYSANNPVYPHLREYMVAVAGIDADRVPISGTASYSAITRGYAYHIDNVTYENSGIFSLTGTANFSVDFGNDSLSTSFSNFAGVRVAGVGADPVSAISHTFTGFSADGYLVDSANNSIGADFYSVANPAGASFSGGFFGTNAAEIGGTFHVNQGTDSGPSQTEIAGAFIGTKN